MIENKKHNYFNRPIRNAIPPVKSKTNQPPETNKIISQPILLKKIKHKQQYITKALLTEEKKDLVIECNFPCQNFMPKNKISLN
jgi:hypothetical protein